MIVNGFGKAGPGRKIILTGDIDIDGRYKLPTTRVIFETKHFIIYRKCRPRFVLSKGLNAFVLRDVPYGLPKINFKKF